jgi:transcriptional regulator with PAS, ATPase and Fis domain
LQSLEEMERIHIAKVLASVGGHRDKAASILGITRSTLWRKINKFGLVE